MTVRRKGLPASYKKAMRALRRNKIRVGFFPEARYTDGTQIAYVAAIQEFGYPAGGIPSRAFLRPTIREQKGNWSRQIAGATIAAIEGDIRMEDGLGQVGALAAGDVSQSIANVTSPPLDEDTVEARKNKRANEPADAGPGSSSGIRKPLVDTGQMLQAVSWRVT